MPEENKEKEQKKEFQNLDLKTIQMFGAMPKTVSNWKDLAQQSKTFGWKKTDRKTLEVSLARNVEQSYFRIISFSAVDLDNEIEWRASFQNDKGLWDLKIANSPKAEIEPSQMRDFFSSELFQKIAKKAGQVLDEAKHLLKDVLVIHIEKGEMLKIDDVKLSAIMHWLDDKQFCENLKSGKFMTID